MVQGVRDSICAPNIVWSSPSGPMTLSFAAGSLDGGNECSTLGGS